MEPGFESIVADCAHLQRRLKDQYLLLNTEQEQKANLQKKLSLSLQSYYRNLVHIDGHSSRRNKILFEDQGLGDCYIFIKDVILTLAKRQDIMLAIIQKHNNWSTTMSFQGITNVIVDSMYENVVDDQLGHKDILRLLDGLIAHIVSSKNNLEQINFQESDLVHYIIQTFTKKSEYHSYAASIVKSTLLELAKTDRPIDFSLVQEDDMKSIKKIPSKKFDSPVKKNVHSKSFYEHEIFATKSSAYSDAFRKKDLKIRTHASIRTKNKNCVSNDLLRYLGIDENISFPIFNANSVGSQMELPKQQYLNKQEQIMMLSRKDSQSGGPDVTLLKNLVFTFLGDLFKRLYSMPMVMRVICKLLYGRLEDKFKNRVKCLDTVAIFVIKFWILSEMRFDEQLVETGKIADFTNSNTKVVHRTIMAILKNNIKFAQQGFQYELDLMISSLRMSIQNYITQLINIQAPVLNEPTTSQNYCYIKSYSVCLTIGDISKFLQMIKNTKKQLPEEAKLMNKVDRIFEMSKDTDIFGKRKDKNTGREYSENQSYVLFSELALPKDLSFDYSKFYNDAFRKEKGKNVLRQVLLSTADLDQMDDYPHQCSQLRDIFHHILKTRQQRLGLNSLDRIPVQLKIQYLLTLTKNRKIQSLIQPMLQQLGERFRCLQKVWDKTKQCYLKAISGVIQQNYKIANSQQTLKQEIKKSILDQFMTKCKVNVCLTSPRTRQKEIVLKTNMMKEMAQEEKDRIWVQNQSKCIHTALNLEFIKSLTGDADKNKTKYESHLSTASKFAQIFCALPEVKEKGMSGDDNYGIKDTLENFIEYCICLIKADKNYSILADDMDWLEENLEQRITKRIYDKLYPKMPTYDDLGLYFRLKTLDWVGYEHLKVHPLMQVDGMWDIAAKNLKHIDKLKTASEKLNAILQCSRVISQSYSLVSPDDKPVTADDIYPIVVYVLIKAAPRRLVSNMSFIQMFANKNKLLSRNGYFFTQLKSVIQYCENLSHSSLGMNMVDFNCNIYEKQLQYGIYFLLRRKKESPRTTLLKIEYLKNNYFQKDTAQNTQTQN